jgi:leucyl/phenylalanyl-tRNA---protein transferase
VRFDTDFAGVVAGCRRPAGTWITDEIARVSLEAHREGWAHSAECWSEGGLAGGVYGYALGACFFAESMFHRQTDASKVALWALVNECRRLGFTLFDAQIMNPHLASLGAYAVKDAEFKRLLALALARTTSWSLATVAPPETR